MFECLQQIDINSANSEIILHCVSVGISSQLQQWTNFCTNFSPKSGGVGDATSSVRFLIGVVTVPANRPVWGDGTYCDVMMMLCLTALITWCHTLGIMLTLLVCII